MPRLSSITSKNLTGIGLTLVAALPPTSSLTLISVSQPPVTGTNNADNMTADDQYIVGTSNLKVASGKTLKGEAYVYSVEDGSYLYSIPNPTVVGFANGTEFGRGALAIRDGFLWVGNTTATNGGVSFKGELYKISLAEPSNITIYTIPTGAFTQFGQAIAFNDSLTCVSNATSSSRVFVYESDMTFRLTIEHPTSPTSSNSFGWRMFLNATNLLVVTAPFGSSGTVFLFNAFTGALTQTITNPKELGDVNTGSARLGIKVAGNNNYFAVVDDQDSDGTITGVVYLYETNNANYTATLVKALTNPNVSGTGTDDFGRSVFMDSQYLYVSASAEYNFDGVVYVYNFEGDLIRILTLPASSFGDFADSIQAVRNGSLLIGNSFRGFSTGPDGGLVRYASPMLYPSLQIGDAYRGGFYAGRFTMDGGATSYKLIVAPKTFEVERQAKTTFSDTGTNTTTIDGFARSTEMNTEEFPAARYCMELTANGYTDWYLPSRDELEMLYRNFKPSVDSNSTSTRQSDSLGMGDNANSLPPGAPYTSAIPARTTVSLFQSGGAQAFSSDFSTGNYWSSSRALEQPAYPWRQSFAFGGQTWSDWPTVIFKVRPVRRELEPSTVAGPTWVAATKGFPTTSIDVFSVTNGVLSSSSSTLYSPLEANSYNFDFTISPQNDFVYAPNGTKNRIEIIPVNPNTGIYTGSGATSTSTSALGAFPADISISPDGNYAYVAFNNTFKIGIYSRNTTTGALTGISNLSDGYKFSKMTSDGAYLYTVQNNILMYSRNISTGALTFIAENVEATANGGFAKITISSDNRSLYVADYSQNNFYAYLINPATGMITLGQTINLSSFGAEVRPSAVEVSSNGKHVYVTLSDVNQVLGTTVVMYSRSLTSPFTLTQLNVYTISGAVGEQTANLILTKSQNLLIMSVSGNPGAPIHSWTRDTVTGTLTLNADVTGFGAGIATNVGVPFQPVFTARVFPATLYNSNSDFDAANNRLIINAGANAIFSSSNGTTWTAGTYPAIASTSNFIRVLGDGNYVTGHGGGSILTSTQGNKGYTAITTGLPGGTQYSDFAKSGSTFIVSGGNTIYTSNSIASGYTLRSTVASAKFARNPNTGRLFAWGFSGNNAILQSSDDDGIIWTTRLTITPSPISSNEHASIAWFAPGNCLIASHGWFTGSAATGAIYNIASDGTSYTQVLTASNYLTFVGVDTTNGQAYVSGFGGQLYRSLNGTIWLSQTTNTTNALGAITWMTNVGRLVVQGYQNTTYITSQ